MEQFKKSKYFLEETETGDILLFASRGKLGYKIRLDPAHVGELYLSISSFRDKNYPEESYDLVDANGKEWCEEYRCFTNGVMYVSSYSVCDLEKLVKGDLFQWAAGIRAGANDVLREYFNKVVL